MNTTHARIARTERVGGDGLARHTLVAGRSIRGVAHACMHGDECRASLCLIDESIFVYILIGHASKRPHVALEHVCMPRDS